MKKNIIKLIISIILLIIIVLLIINREKIKNIIPSSETTTYENLYTSFNRGEYKVPKDIKQGDYIVESAPSDGVIIVKESNEGELTQKSYKIDDVLRIDSTVDKIIIQDDYVALKKF